MASASHPGGGWLKGALAQEEDIFMRSTYDLSLSESMHLDTKRNWKYPIPETGGIYSPNVFIFRDNSKNGYAVWDYENCSYLDFVAVAAVRKPEVTNGMMSRRETYITLEKMRTMLRIALMNNHESILLGAFGCGAFGNPPRQIANLFLRVFSEAEFKGRFKNIDFAILDTRNEGNFEIFKRILCPKGKEPANTTGRRGYVAGKERSFPGYPQVPWYW
ncbi:unnamed protein product [Sphagnum tenellum]